MPPLDPAHIAIFLAAGMSAGFLSGLVGMGGGILLVPVLAYLAGMPFKEATGTASLHGLAVGVMAYAIHGQHGAVDTRLGLTAGAGSVVGALAGAAISGLIDPTGVKLVYAAAVLLALALMVLQAEASPAAHALPVRYRAGRAVATGGLTGVVSGIVGAGGAFMLVPLFRWSLRMPIHRAIGTTMLVAIFTTVSATAGKAVLGQVPWIEAGVVVMGSVFGTRLGARLTHRIPARPLRLLLIGLLVLLLLRTLADVV